MSKAKEEKALPKRSILIGVVAIIIGLAVVYLQQNSQSINLNKGVSNRQNAQINRNNCIADDCLAIQDLNYPAGKLPENVKNALDDAIDDEYKALTTYEKVINKFGMIRPFSMIKGAEEQHIASLKAVYDKYGLPYPKNQWTNKITVPTTLQQACQTGVDAEIANAALYRDRLLPLVTGYEDITLVFTNLMNASQQKHLPAFDRCN